MTWGISELLGECPPSKARWALTVNTFSQKIILFQFFLVWWEVTSMFIFMPGKRDPNKIRVQTWRRIFNSLPERLGCSQLWGMTRAKLKPTNDMAEETAPLNTTSQPQSLAART